MDLFFKIFVEWNDCPLHYFINDTFSQQDIINFSIISKNCYLLINQKAQFFFKRLYPNLKEVPVPNSESKYKTWLQLLIAFTKSKIPQNILRTLEINNQEGRYIPVRVMGEKIYLRIDDDNRYRITPSIYNFYFYEKDIPKESYDPLDLMKDGYYKVSEKPFQGACEMFLFGNCDRKISYQNIYDYLYNRSNLYEKEILQVVNKFKSCERGIFGITFLFKLFIYYNI